jgi:hypothetical protein
LKTSEIDLWDGGKFASGDMDQAWNPEQFARQCRDQSTCARPNGMDNGKWCRSMFGRDGTNGSQSGAVSTDIVNLRAGNAPFSGVRFLVQGKHVDLVAHRQAFDQGDQRGNDAKFRRTVHASRHY